MVNRCRGQNATGDPCSAQPVRDDGYCYWHSPATATERAEARRRGGVNRSNKARAKKELPAGMMTTDELCGLVGLTMKGALAGRIEPGVARSVFDGARTYVTVAEAGAVEALTARLDELEALARRGGVA